MRVVGLVMGVAGGLPAGGICASQGTFSSIFNALVLHKIKDLCTGK